MYAKIIIMMIKLIMIVKFAINIVENVTLTAALIALLIEYNKEKHVYVPQIQYHIKIHHGAQVILLNILRL